MQMPGACLPIVFALLLLESYSNRSVSPRLRDKCSLTSIVGHIVLDLSMNWILFDTTPPVANVEQIPNRRSEFS